MQTAADGFEISPAPDGRPYLGDQGTVAKLVEEFVRGVLRAFDAFNSGSMTRDEALAKVNELCQQNGTIFAGEDETYQPANWNGPRLAGRILGSVPGVKAGREPKDTIAGYFDWLAKQVVRVSTEMHKGMADEEAGPVMRQGMRDAVAFLLGVR